MNRSLTGAVIALLLLPAAAHAGAYNKQSVAQPGNTFAPVVVVGDTDPGDSWGWIDQSGTKHTATSYDGVFDKAIAANGTSGTSLAFSTPGRYEYVCQFHSQMRGALVVAPDDDGEGLAILDVDGTIGPRTAAAFTLGGSPAAIVPGLTLDEEDDEQILRATVSITQGLASGDQLAGPSGSTYDAATGVLTITGPMSEADMQQALRQVTFSATGSTGQRTVAVQAVDAGPAEMAGNPDVRVVNVNAAPAKDGGNGGGGGGGTTTPPAGGGGEQPPGTGPNPITPPLPGGIAIGLRRTTFTMDAKGRVTLVFTTEPNLRGTVELLPAATARSAQRRRAALGRASFRANRAGRVSVRVRLTTAARRTLRRSRSRRVRASMVVRAGSRSATRAVTIRRR